jgi:hypothetical protein
MSPGFDEAFRRVKELVADFRANEKFYLSPAYQEQEARRDFIDKFWLAPGWDVNHETQKNPFEQEVKVERKEHGSAKWRRGTGRGGAFLKTPLSGSLPVWRGEREKFFWWRKFQNREFILMSMRHWLAGVLARERPALFRDLPESFKVGHPLPQKQGGAAAPPYLKTVGLTCRSAPKSGRSRPAIRFVHGCELLAG